MKEGRLERVNVRKEVIVSAGTIGSPQILMLSGIGHKDHLRKYGVGHSISIVLRRLQYENNNKINRNNIFNHLLTGTIFKIIIIFDMNT